MLLGTVFQMRGAMPIQKIRPIEALAAVCTFISKVAGQRFSTVMQVERAAFRHNPPDHLLPLIVMRLQVTAEVVLPLICPFAEMAWKPIQPGTTGGG